MVMRALRASLLLFVLLSAASAADLKVKVIDPQSAAVAGAQVSLFSKGSDTALKTAATSPEGIATFAELNSGGTSSGGYEIKVLAPGFASENQDVPANSNAITIQLHLATASETVVVTGTRTPVPAEESGASISTLESAQLETMNPIAADDAIRFLPGAVMNTSGQHGGLSSLFVRGGQSDYNKVIVDGVAVDNPGETFDFGTLPLTEADRVEFLRGTQSTLYGSDDQFNSNGLGVNDAYSDSLQGANLGMAINDHAALRLRVRHSNSYTGLPGEWNFNGDPLLAPDPSESSHLNTLLGSAELTLAAPSGWQHRLTGFDYLYRYTDVNLNSNPDSYDDFPDTYDTHVNRVGFQYQGDYSERASARLAAHTTFGYQIENETGVVNDLDFPPPASGQRLDQDAYLQQQLTLGRLSVIAGGRFVHSSAYGNTGVPRVALTLLALHGGELFSGTRLRFSYATAPNHGLLPERVRAFEAGFEQKLFAGRWALNATYFNNLFHDQIEAIPTPTG